MSLLPLASDDTMIVGFGDKAAVVVGGFVVAGGDAANVGDLAFEVDIGSTLGAQGLEGFKTAPALP